ncbi:MAG: ketol-acid reductoisomerase [Gemmatimonadetes bacterium]|nr:ketol-acid reductoisomerase [Gemmatimonadota bacterium]
MVVRAGPSENAARADGFSPAGPSDLRSCRAIAVLVPDEVAGDVLTRTVLPFASPGALLVFAHGFALRGDVAPDLPDRLDVALVGPLGPGALLRERYVAGQGLAGLAAVVWDHTGKCLETSLAYAAAIGLTRAGVLETTLDEEVVSDLFAEQAVLTGGVVELIRAAFETLVEDGIAEEIAYYSCVQEMKQILDLIYAEGIAGMRARTSGTAQYGGLTRGPRLVPPEVRDRLAGILAEVRDGRFAREWAAQAAAGGPDLKTLREREAAHPIEAAGRRVRERLGGPSRGPDGPPDRTDPLRER